ncbi:MAG: hypothetical protein IPG04_24810 [Polyangiaceae bacterium]|nr:hypothetical protein [Polyangiaceae bacterium]
MHDLVRCAVAFFLLALFGWGCRGGPAQVPSAGLDTSEGALRARPPVRLDLAPLASSRGGVRGLRLEGAAPRLVINGSASGVHEAIFWPDAELLATVDELGAVVIWETKTGRQVRRFVVEGHSATDCRLHSAAVGVDLLFARERWLVLNVRPSHGSARMELYDIAKGERARVFSGKGVSWTPNGRRVVLEGAGDSADTLVVDPLEGTTIAKVPPLTLARISEDGSTLAGVPGLRPTAMQPRALIVADVGQQGARLTSAEVRIERDFSLSTDGKRLAHAEEGGAVVVQSTSGSLADPTSSPAISRLKVLETGEVDSVHFLDENVLLVVGSAGVASVDASKGTVLARAPAPDDAERWARAPHGLRR